MVHTIARVIILFCRRPPAKIEDRSKCCTMVQLSKVFLSAALLICFSSTSEAQGCTARVLSDYMDCVAANPCECAECDPDPTDDSPLIPVNRPEDCLDVARIYCPLIKCCSICEEEAFSVRLTDSPPACWGRPAHWTTVATPIPYKTLIVIQLHHRLKAVLPPRVPRRVPPMYPLLRPLNCQALNQLWLQHP
jgi:hypothetical protein